MRGISIYKLIAAAVILIVFGLVRLPLEEGIEDQLREAKFVDDNVDLPMMDKLGQGGFAAALGGFRPLVASVYYLIAFTQAMDEEEWGRVDQSFGLITTLQPHNEHYWEQYVWQIGWNAFAWANNEAEFQERLGNDWKADNLRSFSAPGYLERAEEIALKGARIIDDDWRFYQRVGNLYDEKFDDRCEAARWYKKGADLDGAPNFMHSIYVIYLADCEGAEDEVYPLLQQRYWSEDPRGRSPSVILRMDRIESFLAQREIDELGIDEVKRRAAKEREDRDGYLERAALAQYYSGAGKDPQAAMAVYEDMLKPGGPDVPNYYKLKWAMLAADVPGQEEVAYGTMRQVFKFDRRRPSAEEEAVLRILESKVDVPEGMELYPTRDK